MVLVELVPKRTDRDEMHSATELIDEPKAIDSACEEAGGDSTDDAERQGGTPLRPATGFILAVALVLSMVLGWMVVRVHHSREDQAERHAMLQVARQGAVNLTTIDWQQADADVRRIMDGATGEFYEDFAQRSGPFIDMVKRFRSTSVGTVTEAGLESATAGGAHALVAVTVAKSDSGDSEQQPRSWRLRISVQKIDDAIKVSNVEFVP